MVLLLAHTNGDLSKWRHHIGEHDSIDMELSRIDSVNPAVLAMGEPWSGMAWMGNGGMRRRYGAVQLSMHRA